MKNTRKILIALVLVLAMIMSMATLFASAAAPTTLYLKPNSNWTQAGARFAARFWNDSGEKWVNMTDSDGDGVYECEVPDGMTLVIFCRMNPGTTTNNWNNKWNQTGDLTVPDNGKNLYTVKEGTWDKGGGEWSTLGGCNHTAVEGSEIVVNAPNCTEKGSSTYLCSICNTRYEDDVDALGHKWENNECVFPDCDATCITVYVDNVAGWSAIHFYCWDASGSPVGGAWPGDKMEANEDGLYEAHILPEAKNLQFNCGNSSKEKNVTIPTGDNIVYNNSTNAWGKLPCKHSYSEEITTEATCDEAGLKTFTCSKCGDTKTEVIPAYHNGNMTHVPAKDAIDCKNPGNIEHWLCPGCNEYFSDANAINILNPWLISITVDCVRPEGAADCATVPCAVCGEELVGSGEHDTGVAACKDGTCSKCGAEITGYGCENYATPACGDGVCYYCGGFVAGFGHENGAWAPCQPGECSYGCGLAYPATAEHVDEDANDYCDNCYDHLKHDVDPCVGGECSICWTYIDPLGHSFDKGVCSVCGAEDPDYVAPSEDKIYIFESSTLEGFKDTEDDEDSTTENENPYEGLQTIVNDYFTIIFNTKSKVDSSTKTWKEEDYGDKAYTSSQRLYLGGMTTVNGPAIKFTTASPATVVVWWVSNGADGTRPVGILDADGNIVAQDTSVVAKNAVAVSVFELEAAGTYYLGNMVDNNYFFKVQVTEKAASEPVDPPHEHEVTHIDAVAPGCHYIGNIEYWVCYGCDGVWTDEALTQPSNREDVIVPALGGEVKHVEAKAPTCYLEGNIEYWYCETCEQVWQDEALTQLTNRMNVKIGATHTNLVHFDAVAPACHFNGNVEYWVCYDCEGVWTDDLLRQVSNIKNVVVPALGGEVNHVEAKAPTCTEIGNIEYWYCETCEQVWQDAALTQLTNRMNVKIGATGHYCVLDICYYCYLPQPSIVVGENKVAVDAAVGYKFGMVYISAAGKYQISAPGSTAVCFFTDPIYAEGSDFSIAADGTLGSSWSKFSDVAELEAGYYYVGIYGAGELTVTIGDYVAPAYNNTIALGDNHYIISEELLAKGYEFLLIEITTPGTYVFTGGAPMTLFVFHDPYLGELFDDTAPFTDNVDDLTFEYVQSFEVELTAAGYYWVGFRYDWVGDLREFDINVSLKEEEEHKHNFVEGKCECGETDPDYKPEEKPGDDVQPEPKPEPELDLFQKILKAITDFFAKIGAWFKNLVAGFKK